MAAARTRVEQLLDEIAVRLQDVDLRFEPGTLQLKYGVERESVPWLKCVLEFEPDQAGAKEALERHKREKAPLAAE